MLDQIAALMQQAHDIAEAMRSSAHALQQMRSTAGQLLQRAVPRWLAAKRPAARRSTAMHSYMRAQEVDTQAAQSSRQRWRRAARHVSASGVAVEDVE